MICDLSQYGCIKIVGENAQTFLQGQLTCDLREITHEKVSYAAYCNNKGRVISVLRVIKHYDDYFLFTTGTYVKPTFKNLKIFGQFSKIECTLESPNINHFGFCGEDAVKNLTQLNLEIPKETNQVIQTVNYIIVKNAGENNFELLVFSPEFSEIKTQPNDQTWQLCLIESLVPSITEETCEKFTPHMLSLKNLDAISFTKGCYIGQEIVARTEHLGKVKRTLQKGKITDNLGTIINQCDDQVLHIT